MAKLILSLDGMVLRDIPLTKERTTIGRKPHNDIVIDNLAVSGEHAMIMTILNDSFLEDLGSTNGTLVNGQPIKKHFLQNNDVVELGKYKLKYVTEARAAGEPGRLREDHGAAGAQAAVGQAPSLAAKGPEESAAGRQELRRHGGQPRDDAEPEHRRQSARGCTPGLAAGGARLLPRRRQRPRRRRTGPRGSAAPATAPAAPLRRRPAPRLLRATAPAAMPAAAASRARSRSCPAPAPARSCRCPSRSLRWASPACRSR